MAATSTPPTTPLLDLLFDEPGAARCVVGLDGTVLRANREWGRLAGSSSGGATEARPVGPLRDRDLGSAVRACAREGRRIALRLPPSDARGREAPWEATIDPVLVDGGRAALVTARQAGGAPLEPARGSGRPSEQPLRADELQSLRESESQLRAIVASMPDGVVVQDAGGEILACNAAAERMLGTSREQMARQRSLHSQLRAIRADGSDVPDDEPPSASEALETGSGRRGRIVGLELPDGTRRWLSVSAEPVWRRRRPRALATGAHPRASRGARAVVTTLTDVTDLQERILQLGETAARLDFQLNGASGGCWEWDVRSGRVDRTPRCLAMLGYAPPEVEPDVGAWQALIHPDDRDGVTAALQAHLRGEADQYCSEHRLRRKDGRWSWVLDRGRVVERDAAGRPVRMAGAHVDITDRKRTEGALRASEEIFRTLAENTPDLVVRYDASGRCRYLNSAARAAIGRPVSEVLGRTGAELGEAVPLLSSVHAQIAQVLQKGVPTTVELAQPSQGGERIYDCRLAPERDSHGVIGSILAVSRDVTDRKRHEEQLRRLGARIDEVREEEQARIARDLHDVMGQLLTALKLRLERIERAVDEMGAGERERALLDMVVAATELADEAQAAVRRLAVDLRSPVLDGLGLGEAVRREVRQVQEQVGVACAVCVPEGPLPLAPERASAAYRILQEALTNVVRHAQARHVLVALELVDGRLVLRVEDDGRGLPSSAESSGVGLAGMRERAERLGGTLRVEPRSGSGTVVLAQIPVQGAC